MKKSANRPKTGRRAPKSAFKPGQSGNPNGRPKKTQEEYDLEAACKEKAPAAIKVIEALMYGADKDSVKLAAATFIIERGHGKAVQKSELTGKDGAPIAMDVNLAPAEAYRRMLEGACPRPS